LKNLLVKLESTKQYLLDFINESPKIGLILGSGLGTLADEIESPLVIDYKDIPNYLSKSELRMMQKLGADTVGMSTVPEVIVARHSGMKVIGISCVTDMAIPDQLESISHEQVIEVANRTKPKFINLVKEIINEVCL